MAHIIESQNSVTISLEQTNTEIAIYAKKININHEKKNIVNDSPENVSHPYEIRYDGKNVGFNNFPNNLVLPIYETMILGFPESFILPDMDENGKVIDLKQNSDKKLIIRIFLTKDNVRISNTTPGIIVDTNMAKIIFTVTGQPL